jgi:hypothetical protein
MNLTYVVILICINGAHIKLLGIWAYKHVDMANWNTLPTAVNKQTVPLRAGFPVNPVCRYKQQRERGVTQFSYTNHLSVSTHTADYPTLYKIFQNIGSIS